MILKNGNVDSLLDEYEEQYNLVKRGYYVLIGILAGLAYFDKISIEIALFIILVIQQVSIFQLRLRVNEAIASNLRTSQQLEEIIQNEITDQINNSNTDN